jgi:uncharacterized protein GlcG (DUF336 family)
MITLQKARQAVDAAEKKAVELGVAVTTVVVDEHGTLIAVSRMDEALVISPKFASAKAYTSATLGFPTHALEPFAAQDKPYFGINTLFGGELTTIAGGLPVMMSGKRVGAVGVGGSADTQQDMMCAQEAVKILEA